MSLIPDDATAPDLRSQLDAPFGLGADDRARFQQDGYVKLKHVLSSEVLAYYGREISRKVRELNTLYLPMEQRTTYQKAFLQVMNLWTKSDLVREFVFSKRLARMAAELMGCRAVRLYHDQALYKEPGGGITPWHADQFYWPLETVHTVTAWIPLQQTPLELGPLAFSRTSHRYTGGRDIEISDESEQRISRALLEEGLPLDETPYDLGEVSFHLGWTYHRAGANRSDQPREVMTIIYFDAEARIATPRNKAQQNDLRTWFPGRQPGDLGDSPLNPVLWNG